MFPLGAAPDMAGRIGQPSSVMIARRAGPPQRAPRFAPRFASASIRWHHREVRRREGRMATTLSGDQIEFYRRQGYLFPLRCLGAGETASMCDGLDAFEREEGFSAGSIHFKGHLCFRWSWELARSAAILDAVEDLIGPDILSFASRFWIKGGGDLGVLRLQGSPTLRCRPSISCALGAMLAPAMAAPL